MFAAESDPVIIQRPLTKPAKAIFLRFVVFIKKLLNRFLTEKLKKSLNVKVINGGVFVQHMKEIY
jgi:hypothetical protein